METRLQKSESSLRVMEIPINTNHLHLSEQHSSFGWEHSATAACCWNVKHPLGKEGPGHRPAAHPQHQPHLSKMPLKKQPEPILYAC